MLWSFVLSIIFPLLVLSQDDDGSDHSNLKIVVPSILHDFAGKEGLKHAQALFGSPSYGGDKKVAGELFYVTPKETSTGCDVTSEDVPKVPAGTHMIFLVDRGDCDFVVKMKVAQSLGAIAVIIADNVCQCKQYENWQDDPSKGRTSALRDKCTQLGELAAKSGRIAPQDKCERGLPFMADDGSGGDVRIPSFLIDYLDAQPLKDCLRKGTFDPTSIFATTCTLETKVIVSLEWDLPARSGKVDWSLWSSSDSEGVFKKAFASTAKALASTVDFTPHYFLWDGEKWGCTIGEICATQCTQGGYYCNPDPDHQLFAGVSGREVVEENLRELCVWEQAKDSGSQGLWWDYVSTFASLCHKGPTPDVAFFNAECSERVHKTIPELNFEKTKKCVSDSWYADSNGKKYKNKKLDSELTGRASLKILQLPTAIVNDVLLRGGVTPVVVLSSICAGYLPGKAPAICVCVEHSTSENVLDCINSRCPPDQKLCSRDNKCYPEAQFAVACSDLCPDPKLTFCASTQSCLPASVPCPQCSNEKPYYCSITKDCNDTPFKCIPDISQTGGTSAFGVFTIAFIVVSFAGCGAYAFWRRQKARLHDDVRAILNSYMALEETEEGNERPTRARRVEPTTPSVQGQDAATYI